MLENLSYKGRCSPRMRCPVSVLKPWGFRAEICGLP